MGDLPSTDIKNMVHGKHLKIPVTDKYIETSDNIFGPNFASQRVKLVRKYPQQANTVYKKYHKNLWIEKEVLMASDVMFVNGLPFVVSISRKLRLATAKHMPNRMREIIIT